MSEQRRDQIVKLLEWLRLAQDTKGGSPGDLDKSRTLQFSNLYAEGNFRELERALELMNTEERWRGHKLRSLRFHTCGYYAGGSQMVLVCNAAQCRPLPRWERQACDRPDHKGHKRPVEERVVVRTAREDLARLGVDWIASVGWDRVCPHEPFLPKEAVWSLEPEQMSRKRTKV